MESNITIWLRENTGIRSERATALLIGDYGSGSLTINSVLAGNQAAAWKRLRDACDQQIKLQEQENPSTDFSVANDSGSPGKFEALPDGGYLSPGPSIEPLPDSHKSAAAVIEENIPAPQRIEQGVKTLKIPPAPDFDEEFPF